MLGFYQFLQQRGATSSYMAAFNTLAKWVLDFLTCKTSAGTQEAANLAAVQQWVVNMGTQLPTLGMRGNRILHDMQSDGEQLAPSELFEAHNHYVLLALDIISEFISPSTPKSSCGPLP